MTTPGSGPVGELDWSSALSSGIRLTVRREPVPGRCRLRIGRRLAVAGAAVLVLIGGLAAPLGAQSLYDPDDVLYRHLAVWEQKGLPGAAAAAAPLSAATGDGAAAAGGGGG